MTTFTKMRIFEEDAGVAHVRKGEPKLAGISPRTTAAVLSSFLYDRFLRLFGLSVLPVKPQLLREENLNIPSC